MIGIAQYGIVYTGKEGKIAEHGGDHPDDRNVPILVVRPGADGGTAVTAPVETTQIASKKIFYTLNENNCSPGRERTKPS